MLFAYYEGEQETGKTRMIFANRNWLSLLVVYILLYVCIYLKGHDMVVRIVGSL